MKIVKGKIKVLELTEMSTKMYDGLVKAVVDIAKGIIGVDSPMHADIEAVMLESGSVQDDLWGINLYPEMYDSEFVEFDSMINLRPSQNNSTRAVESIELQNKIKETVAQRVEK